MIAFSLKVKEWDHHESIYAANDMEDAREDFWNDLNDSDRQILHTSIVAARAEGFDALAEQYDPDRGSILIGWKTDSQVWGCLDPANETKMWEEKVIEAGPVGRFVIGSTVGTIKPMKEKIKIGDITFNFEWYVDKSGFKVSSGIAEDYHHAKFFINTITAPLLVRMKGD